MRLRSKNNAVSGVCAVALFIFVGCAIALSGIMSDVDASVLKFGLIAYLFMAVPIFLASFSGRWTTMKHRNFRGTLPTMVGKRVKPRLRRLSNASVRE